MRARIKFGWTVLLALLLFIAPVQGLLCQQACALCVHPKEMKTAVMTQHCMGMAMAATHACVSNTACCASARQTQPAAPAGSAPDANLASSHLSVKTALLPITMMAVSLERAAPPGVFHPPVVALRV